MTEYEIKNYVDDNGNEPVKNWFNSLDGTMRKRVLLRLNRLQGGNFGDYKQIENNLYELRLMYGSGYRIYYTILATIIVLLINAGDKNTQVKDIRRAKEILKKIKGQRYE